MSDSVDPFRSGSHIMATCGDPSLMSDAEISAVLGRMATVRHSIALTLVERAAFWLVASRLAREQRRREVSP